MGYDKNSFLAGIAAGRAMKSFPMMEGEKLFSFIIDTRYNTVDGKTFTFCVGEGTSTTTRIYWGDGQSTLVQWNYDPGTGYGDRYSHTYEMAGVYNIVIDGTISDFEFGNYWSSGLTPKCLVSINTPLSIEPGFPSTASRIPLSYKFFGCENLIHLPKGLFKAYSEANYNECEIVGMFKGCSKLKTIPINLFDGLPKLSTRSIDAFGRRWFDNGPESLEYNTGCDELFCRCSSLEEIQEGIFDYPCFETALSARSVFYRCTSLRSVPKRCYTRFINCETFKYAFRETISLSEVGDYAFANCGKTQYFAYLFYRQGWSDTGSALIVGEGIFEDCVAVTDMSFCFAHSNLQNLTEGIFDDMTLAVNWEQALRNNFHLTSVPGGVFSSVPNTSGVSFASCFSSNNAINSAVPELWISHSNANGTGCFSGCRNASNWSSIPSAWGGPA